MIPERLTLEGLYSYQERQTIDFNTLTQAGLFGVFGAVGSGKSSILEAITFALFGKTERLNERGDSRNYNMMNLKSNRTYIEFDFYNFEDRHFRITREYKRHKNKFREVQVETPVLYEHINGEWIPLEHTDVESLIGLSYTNFKRTIIIPQGQFKEFLELGSKDRTQMMKEIFHLQRFDLQDKVAVLNKKNQSKLDTLHGKLSGYEEITPEIIHEQEQLLQIEQGRLQEQENTLGLLNDKFQLLKKRKADIEEWTKTKEELAQVVLQEDEMNGLQKQLTTYERTYQVFYQLLIDRKRLTKELTQLQSEQQQQQATLTSLNQQQRDLSEQFEGIKARHEKLAQQKDQAEDFLLLAKIQDLHVLTLQKQREIAHANAEINRAKTQFQAQETALTKLSAEVGALRSNKLDPQTLIEVSDWFTKQSRLKEVCANNEKTLADTKEQIIQIEAERSTYEADPDHKIQTKETEKKALEAKRTLLAVQQKLAEYAHTLHDGSPCPLCGSIEHSHIAEHSDLSDEIHAIQTQIAICDNHIIQLQENKTQANKLAERQKLFVEQAQKAESDIRTIEQQLQELRALFVWDTFDQNDRQAFERKRADDIQLEKLIHRREQEISEVRLAIDNKRNKLNELNNSLNKIELSQGQIEAQITNSKSHLKVLNDADYNQTTVAELQSKHQELSQYIQHTEAAFTDISEKLNNNRTALAAQESLQTATAKQIESREHELQSVKLDIDSALSREQFNTIEEVRTILTQQLDIEGTRATLEAYRVKLESLRTVVSRLENNLQHVEFDEAEFTALGQQIEEMVSQVKASTELVAQIRGNLVRIRKQYEEKKDLLQQQEQLQKRTDNLKLMGRLFKAQGFVEYVSSIFLRQLADHANIRFRRMTRNQLSLSVNEENDFEIIDYLNEGRSRNVKTLSGGQAFQVSLSLALALAESVQSQSKANRNFFFIDEGFGTQDSESVNMVFETLLSLQKENRIVGIISHVEELKERIPAAIHIHKDEALGSLVSTN
jgi:exonuclease SbcC